MAVNGWARGRKSQLKSNVFVAAICLGLFFLESSLGVNCEQVSLLHVDLNKMYHRGIGVGTGGIAPPTFQQFAYRLCTK